jgi:hypothetical protein
MIRLGCAREKEVAELLRRGHWPQACAPELREHVAKCPACSDLVLVTQSFQAARTTPLSAPRFESAGALWWRAQLRRRNAAIERINRPIVGAQIFAFAIAVVLGIGVFGWEIRHGHDLAGWFAGLPRALRFGALLPAFFPEFQGSLWPLVLLATLALVGGVIVCLGSEKQ